MVLCDFNPTHLLLPSCPPSTLATSPPTEKNRSHCGAVVCHSVPHSTPFGPHFSACSAHRNDSLVWCEGSGFCYSVCTVSPLDPSWTSSCCPMSWGPCGFGSVESGPSHTPAVYQKAPPIGWANGSGPKRYMSVSAPLLSCFGGWFICNSSNQEQLYPAAQLRCRACSPEYCSC